MKENTVHSRINIAIDGHSSCGKSTIAKRLAKSLGYKYLDTGAMYRGVTLFTLRQGLWRADSPDEESIVKALPQINLDFRQVGGKNSLFLNGQNVEEDIRGMEVSSKVSPIAAIPTVREYLVKQQQEIALERGVVMDGRDIGTVVLPDAEVKFFITASPQVRAYRRFEELQQKGCKISYEEVLENVQTRDRIDSNRAIAPLRQAPDAHYIDNSDLSLEEQDKVVYRIVQEYFRDHSC